MHMLHTYICIILDSMTLTGKKEVTQQLALIDILIQQQQHHQPADTKHMTQQ